MDGTTACAVLGVSPGASRQMIKKAFRRLARLAHPDQSGNAEAFRVLKSAYDVAFAQAISEEVSLKPAGCELAEPQQTTSDVPQPVLDGDRPTPNDANPGLARRAAWLTGVLREYPATDSYHEFVARVPVPPRSQATQLDDSRVASSVEANQRHQNFARCLDNALQEAA